MKIAIDAYYALFQSGGIARYSRCLISAIAEITSSDRLVLFYNRFRERGPAWQPQSDICRIRQLYFPRRLLECLWHSVDWPPIEVFCGSVDLFHGLHFILPPSRKALKVLTVHDLTYLKFPDYFTERRLNERGYRQLLPRALARAHAVIAVSHKTREDLIDLMRFPEDKVRVIHEGVEPHFFVPLEERKAADIRQRYGLISPYLIFLVGTPEPRKNLANTVTAVRRAAPKLNLALVGPQKPLRKLIGDNVQHVTFTDVVSDEHLPALLSGAQISLYPSLYEGFGLPVLESMASGVPVIASNRGALPEVAGEAAILIDPEDVDSMAEAISALLADETLQRRLAVMGKKRAAEFSWRKTALETLALYRELI